MLSRVSRQWRVPVSRTVGRGNKWKSYKTRPKKNTFWRPIRPTCDGAVIIPHCVQNATPDTFLRHVAHQQWRIADTLPVFLLTPSFAQWLAEDHTFLQGAVNRLFEGRKKRDMRVLAAVVDKVPAPNVDDPAHDYTDGDLSQSLASTGSQTGFEGIAYTFLPLISQKHRPSSELSGTGSISFQHWFRPAPTLEDVSKDDHIHTLRLPLANTVFQTGSPTTMVYSTWSKESDKQEEPKRTSWRNISHIALAIRTKQLSKVSRASSMNIPLVPLTLPREIEAGMGNIVRRIVGSNNASIPASTELEDVVPRYFESRGLSPQSITAWALVMPKNLVESVLSSTKSMLSSDAGSINVGDTEPDEESWKALWNNNESMQQHFVANAIAHGARLHRILSGGGGWGKKAGLLALDPEISYDESVSSSSAEDENSTVTSMDIWGSAHELVRPGEFIQFLTLAPNSSLSPGRITDQQDTVRDWDWEFGTLPSTVDAMPVSPSAPLDSKASTVSVFGNYFGALTEGALTIVERSPCKANALGSSETVNATKIDVPHTRLYGAVKAGTPRNIEAGYQRPTVKIRKLSTGEPNPQERKKRGLRELSRDKVVSTNVVRYIKDPLSKLPTEEVKTTKEAAHRHHTLKIRRYSPLKITRYASSTRLKRNQHRPLTFRKVASANIIRYARKKSPPSLTESRPFKLRIVKSPIEQEVIPQEPKKPINIAEPVPQDKAPERPRFRVRNVRFASLIKKPRETRRDRRHTSAERSLAYRPVKALRLRRREREHDWETRRQDMRTPRSEAREKEIQEWRAKREKRRELLEEVSGWLL